jgi:hypothetical protein
VGNYEAAPRELRGSGPGLPRLPSVTVPRLGMVLRLMLVACGLLAIAAAIAPGRVLPGEKGCGRILLRGDFAGRVDVVVVANRTDCRTALRVARRTASRRTVFGSRAPAPAGWTCMTSFRPSLGYILRHAVTCQRGRNLRSIGRPAVALSLPPGEPLHCGDVRINLKLRPDPTGIFGAFGILASGGQSDCPAARDIASRYVRNPTERARIVVHGWTCTQRPGGKAQETFVTCKRQRATVSFTDETPNG